ncbi:MAG: GNAT family N-acetyltransferase [Stellaceae bacterium]
MDLRSTTLRSERLSLEAFTADDAAEVFDAVTPALTRFMSFEPSPSLEAFGEVWQEWLPQMAASTAAFLVVRENQTGQLLGVAGLHRIDSGEPEAGIWIKERAHRRGFGREAVSVIIAWASADFGATGLLWPVMEENHQSRRLAESLGGVIVGRDCLRKANGVEHPEVIYKIPARAT